MHALHSAAKHCCVQQHKACLLEPAAKTHKNSSSSVLSLMQAAAAGWLYYTLDPPPSMPDPQLALIGSSIFEMNLSNKYEQSSTTINALVIKTIIFEN